MTTSVGPGTWTGPAAEEARSRSVDLAGRLDGLTGALHSLESALARGADQLSVLTATIQVEQLASAASGSDVLPLHRQSASPAVTRLAEDLDLQLASALAAIATDLATMPRPPEARNAFGVASAALPAAVSGPASAVPPGSGGLPGSGALPGSAHLPTPASDVAMWWIGLTAAEQESAVTQSPETIGSTAALPGWARDRANRLLLDRAESDLAAEVATLEPTPRTWRDLFDSPGALAGQMTIGTFGGGSKRVAYQQAVGKLAAVRQTRGVLDQHDGRQRQLLVFDVSGRSARVAVSVGDVDRADHVAVVVPGFTTTVQRDLAGSDRLSAELVDQTRHAATLIGDRREVAVVSWLAYDIPQTSDTLNSGHSVALRQSAEAGARSLADFLRGVPPERHLTVVGHSYGSTTAGLAVASGGTGIDDLVVLGSPGLGVERVTDLEIPAKRIHVLEADDDPVADLGWFGRDPSAMPEVDRLATQAAQLPDGFAGSAASGHSRYLTSGTTSQWNVAAVVAGAPVVRAGRLAASW
ncbi:MAG TPA: alpha/beta hydrolase [Lapillicoccus sp.]|nr:alpha/beta hydrolase [Lapillicoccus sp.]